jgi:hypothetical protein
MTIECQLGMVVCNRGDGTCEALTILWFSQPMPTKEAIKLASGVPLLAQFRAGPWSVKKSIVSLINRLPGYHVDQASVTSRVSPGTVQRKESRNWTLPKDELRAGVAFINSECPARDAENLQYLWVLEHIQEDAMFNEKPSPIAGWPESKVLKMAQNKSKSMSGAAPKTGFPLNTYSMKPVMSEFLLPMIYPLLTSFLVLMLGWPKVGKTPGFIIMGLAMGRYHIRQSGKNAQPCWRRSKNLDNFRHRVQMLWEALSWMTLAVRR